jgi:hypothetical protein
VLPSSTTVVSQRFDFQRRPRNNFHQQLVGAFEELPRKEGQPISHSTSFMSFQKGSVKNMEAVGVSLDGDQAPPKNLLIEFSGLGEKVRYC